ncbi:MAG: HD domain-containing protein [Candidatus Omnitrophica bacterium]|nr:HD domain-containing protein [Candidatus Omnitrophota bacterium]
MNVEIARQFMEKHVTDREHALHVENLSLQLFDQLRELHHGGEIERQLLQCAAYLHDIGCVVSYQKHHVNSLRIILDANLPSFRSREKQMIANIARYHRKSTPKHKHYEFASLPPDDQTTVKKMSALLRIADALDRSHGSKIQSLQCTLVNSKCYCVLSAKEDCPEEKSAVLKRKDLFRDVFGVNFRIAVEIEEKSDDSSHIYQEMAPVYNELQTIG